MASTAWMVIQLLLAHHEVQDYYPKLRIKVYTCSARIVIYSQFGIIMELSLLLPQLLVKYTCTVCENHSVNANEHQLVSQRATIPLGYSNLSYMGGNSFLKLT